jgi:hypothetical protein
MAEAAASQTIMTQIMNNPTVLLIGAAAGYAVAKVTGRKNRGGMGGF